MKNFIFCIGLFCAFFSMLSYSQKRIDPDPITFQPNNIIVLYLT